jgi:hypothetical protein
MMTRYKARMVKVREVSKEQNSLDFTVLVLKKFKSKLVLDVSLVSGERFALKEDL